MTFTNRTIELIHCCLLSSYSYSCLTRRADHVWSKGKPWAEYHYMFVGCHQSNSWNAIGKVPTVFVCHLMRRFGKASNCYLFYHKKHTCNYPHSSKRFTTLVGDICSVILYGSVPSQPNKYIHIHKKKSHAIRHSFKDRNTCNWNIHLRQV